MTRRRGSPSSAAGCAGHRRGARLRRRGARRHALREPPAPRRRDVLCRAERPLARQRPACRAPLLHRLSRAASTASASPGWSPGSPGCACPCCARAPRRPTCAATRCPAPLHLGGRSSLRAAAGRRERLAAVRAAPRSGGSTRTTRRSTSRRSAAGSAPTASRRARSTALWNLIALPTLNLPADEASLQQRCRSSARACWIRPTPPTSGSRAFRCKQLHGAAARRHSSAPASGSSSVHR